MQSPTPLSPSPDESADRARRAFLEKAGKLAVYTPPTMLALMYPGLHAVASGFGGGPGNACNTRAAKKNPHC